jgi:hypothetical protein
MVRALVGVQLQDYPGARWSVGQRVRGCADADVEEAFDSGRILRTHVLRPTWHFVTPDDIRWMVALTAPRVHALNAYHYRKLGLDEALFAKCREVFAKTLQGGKQLTRAELAHVLAGAGIVADGLRLSYIMMHTELEGLICSGASRGKRQTYALLEERAPQARILGRDEALIELVRRFFAGHGPATLKDFVWWSGLAVAEARQVLGFAKSELLRERVEGEEYWFVEGEVSDAPNGLTAHLLPEYDEYFLPFQHINFTDLAWAIDPSSWDDFFYRPIIVGGQRAGTWRRTVGKGGIQLDVRLFAELDGGQWGAIEAAAGRYGEYMGMPVKVERFG